MEPLLVLTYIVFCLLVGFVGRRTRVGYWGTAFVAFLLTPLLTFIVLILFGRRAEA